MRTHLVTITALAGLGLASATHGQANRFLLEETTIDTSQRQQFEAGQKDYCAAVVRGGAPYCVVLAPTTFASNSSYLVMLSFRSYGHYDEGTYTSKGLTPEQASELSKRRGPTIRHNEESGFEEVFRHGPESTGTMPIVQITELTVHPGYESQVTAWLSKTLAQSKGAAVYQSVAGGSTGRFLVFRYLARFADLDDLQPLVPKAPADAAATHAWQQGVSAMRVTVMKMRDDLSTFAH